MSRLCHFRHGGQTAKLVVAESGINIRTLGLVFGLNPLTIGFNGTLTNPDANGLIASTSLEFFPPPDGRTEAMAIIVSGQSAGDAVPSSAGTQLLAAGAHSDYIDQTYKFFQGLLLVETAPAFEDLASILLKGPVRRSADGTEVKVKLPVANESYKAFIQQDPHLEDMIEPVSISHAYVLSHLVTAAICFVAAEPDDDSIVASHMDRLVDAIFAIMAEAFKQRLQRKRNHVEDSLTIQRLRPDYMVLLAGVLMFKAEDKPASGSLADAGADLVAKMKDWSDVLHDEAEYLLCCATSGYALRFAALRRGDESKLHWLGDEVDTYARHGRVKAMMCSMVVFGIILQQRRQLPDSTVLLGHTSIYNECTYITVMDGYIRKQVKLEAMPKMSEAEVNRLTTVYNAVRGKECIACVVHPPKRRKEFYDVSIKPIGTPLSGAPRNLDSLKAAIRCWLKGLDALHKAGTGHGDVRWPNLIHVYAETYCVVDLESSVALGCKPTQPFPVSWYDGEALVQETYTRQSDIWQVGKLLEAAVSVDDDLGKHLVGLLLSKGTYTVDELLSNAWFSQCNRV